jgi:hypothetical protein
MYINLHGNTRHSKVIVDRPELYNMIAPEVIIEEKMTIKDRTPDECYKRYKDCLESQIKNEFRMSGNSITVYPGKDPDRVHQHLHRNLRRKTGRYTKIIEKICGKKSGARRRRRNGNGYSHAKKEPQVYIQELEGTYCICGRTYYEIYGRDPAWSDS